jgi:hypothetical protein
LELGHGFSDVLKSIYLKVRARDVLRGNSVMPGIDSLIPEGTKGSKEEGGPLHGLPVYRGWSRDLID